MNKYLKIGFSLLYMCSLVVLLGNAEQSTIPLLSNNSIEKPEEIDLTNCKTYFDGCNNCMVGEGGMLACTRMFCPEEARSQPKCLEFKDDQENS